MPKRRRRQPVANRQQKHPHQGRKTTGSEKPGPKNFKNVVRLIRGVCCIAGSPSLIADIRSEGEPDTLGESIESLDTPALFDWLIVILSYQGISDQAASAYIEQHGSISWAEIEYRLSKRPSCPKLKSYWHFEGCGYSKDKGTCSKLSHFARCPLPKHRMRNGRLNQTAYSLFLFLRDVTDSDLVNWIDGQLGEPAMSFKKNRLALMREAVIGPLRNVYGVGEKVLSLAFASILLAAQDGRTHWHELGGSLIAVDTLVHKFLQRTGILHAMSAQHPYGAACYSENGCAGIIENVSKRIDARNFNGQFPAYFPRFVQYAIWRYCAQDALNICNGNRITDHKRCTNNWCRLYRQCARKRIRN